MKVCLLSFCVFCVSAFSVASEPIIVTVVGNPLGAYPGDGSLGTEANLDYPYDLQADAAGNVYISTYARIRKWDAATGLLSTIVGNGTSGSDGDGGLATSATISYGSMALDSHLNIYLATGSPTRIRKVDAATGVITTIAGGGEPPKGGDSGDGGLATAATFGYIYNIGADDAGNVYLLSYIDVKNGTENGYHVRKIDAKTGIIDRLSVDTMTYWYRMAVNPKGDVFLGGSDTILKRDAVTGVVTTVAGNSTAVALGDGGLATEASLGFGGTYIAALAATSDALYILNDNRLRKVDLATNIISTLVGSESAISTDNGIRASEFSLNGAYYLGIGGSNVFFTQYSQASYVRKLSAGTPAPNTFDSDGDGFTNAVETLAGTLATDAKSTPFSNLPISRKISEYVSKSSVKLNFKSTSGDSIQLQWSDYRSIPLVAGQDIYVDVGGIARKFSFSGNSKIVSGSDSLSIKTGKNGVSKCQLTLAKGNFKEALTDEGFNNPDAKNAYGYLLMLVNIGDTLYYSYIYVKFSGGKGSGSGSSGNSDPGQDPNTSKR